MAKALADHFAISAAEMMADPKAPTGTVEATQVGGRLAALILSKGLSHRSLATRLGVSNGAVSGWCRGDSIPHPRIAARLAGFLGVSVSDLFAGGSSPPEVASNAKNAAAAHLTKSIDSQNIKRDVDRMESAPKPNLRDALALRKLVRSGGLAMPGMQTEALPTDNPQELAAKLLAISAEIARLAVTCGQAGGSTESYLALAEAQRKLEALGEEMLRPKSSSV
jgi:transcriptional regulator with XRE-family HTH domain